MVHRIHQHFGLTTPEGMDESMNDWLNNGRSDKRGKHLYSAARYGLDVDSIHERFADYIEAFNIPVKKA